MDHLTVLLKPVVSVISLHRSQGGRGALREGEEESKEGNLNAARIHSYLGSVPGSRGQKMFTAKI